MPLRPRRGVCADQWEIELCAGAVWVTQAGDAHDHILAAPGDRFRPTLRRGTIVVQAIQDAVVVLHIRPRDRCPMKSLMDQPALPHGCRPAGTPAAPSDSPW